MKKEIIYKYGDRKFIVQFDDFHDSFELFGSSHADNLFLMNIKLLTIFSGIIGEETVKLIEDYEKKTPKFINLFE